MRDYILHSRRETTFIAEFTELAITKRDVYYKMNSPQDQTDLDLELWNSDNSGYAFGIRDTFIYISILLLSEL